MSRLRRYLDAGAVLVAEIALFVFFLRASSLFGTVDFAHFRRWAGSAGTAPVLTATFRLFGLGVSGWLLSSTLAYWAATLSGNRHLLRGSELLTLPVVRRAIDAMAAASLAASALSAAVPRPALVPAPVPAALTAGPVAVGDQRAAPAAAQAAPAAVDRTAIGRHLPHPGPAAHPVPKLPPPPGGRFAAPSPGDGFSGLPAGTKVVVVEPGDCLSVLAERHLGDWRLDAVIEQLNYGRVQPDGRALLDDHWIYPGWVLVMPPQAVGAVVVGGSAAVPPPARTGLPLPAPPAAAGTPTRQAAPTLSRAPATTTTPSTTAAPPTTAGPSTTSVPAGRSTTSLPSTTPAPSAGSVPSTTSTPAKTVEPSSAVAPSAFAAPSTIKAPATSVSRPAGALPVPVTGAPAANRSQPGESAPPGRISRATDRKGPSVPGAAVGLASIGALAAAGFVWQLDRRRREQAHSRRRGFVIARNGPQVEGAERRARAVAAGEQLVWADLSLRYLSGVVEQLRADGGADLPSLVAMEVGADGVEVVLSPRPRGRLGWFSPHPDGDGLVLDRDIDLGELRELAEQRWPAWPALVSLGERRGRTFLFNLEHAGSVSVEGAPAEVKGFLAGAALQLSSQPWCEDMLSGVCMTGEGLFPVPPGLQQLGPGDTAALADRLAEVSAARQVLTAGQPLSALRAASCEAMPHIVLAFEGTPAATIERLAEVALPERSGLALVAAGPYAGARWRLELGGRAKASLRGEIGGRLVCFDLSVVSDPGEAALLSDALGAGSERESVPAGDDASGPPPGATEVVDIRSSGPQAPEPEHPVPPKEVEVCLLGPVDVMGGDLTALDSSRRMSALAVIAYLAAHPRPISADELATHLWPLDAARDDANGPQRKTVMNVVSRARLVLGYGRGGRERLVHSPMGYQLSDEVSCDWSRFERLVGLARRQGPAEARALLRRALELVRGQPFAGALSSQFFEWVASEHLDFVMSAKAVDVAQELAEIAFAAGDSATVLWAVEKGLQLEPTREEMFRLWMHSLGQAGRAAKVDEVYRRLKLVLRQRIHPLHEPQAETREVWRRYTSMEVAGT